MKKTTFLTSIIMALVIGIAALFFWHIKSNKDFSIEWHPITADTYESLQPTFKAAEAIFIESLFPMVKSYMYTHDQRFIQNSSDPKQTEQEIVAEIRESLHQKWILGLAEISKGLHSKNHTAAYISVAKDSAHTIIGSALFTETPCRELFQEIEKNTTMTIISGSIEPCTGENELYVSGPIIDPRKQQAELGKALLFSSFLHCPHITTLYLITAANEFNTNARSFYEHIGFIPACIFTDNGNPQFGNTWKVYTYHPTIATPN